MRAALRGHDEQAERCTPALRYVRAERREARLVRSALGDLTGAKLANTNRAWLDWWEANKVSWKTPQPKPTGTTTAEPASKNR